jgi:hypothetical protein
MTFEMVSIHDLSCCEFSLVPVIYAYFVFSSQTVVFN